MGKIDISLLVAFSFTPTALLKPCSLIRLFISACFLFFLSGSSSLSHFLLLFFLPFFIICKQFFPLFFPSLSVSFSLSTVLLCYVRTLCVNSVHSHTWSLSVTHTFYNCNQFHTVNGLLFLPTPIPILSLCCLMPPLNASLDS